MKSRKAMLWLVAGQILIATGTLYAQETNRARTNYTDRLVPVRAAGVQPLFSYFLTEEQLHSVEPIVQADQAEIQRLEIKLRDARRDLVLVGIRAPFDEPAVRKQAQVIGEIQADIDVLRFKELAQVQPPLSQEQVQKIKTFSSNPSPTMRVPEPTGRVTQPRPAGATNARPARP
jgi:hypothetical protein